MAVCRYFVKGYCLRGKRCRYEHVDPDSSFQKESLKSNKSNDYFDHASTNNRYNRKNNVYENRTSYKRRNEYTHNEDGYQTNSSQHNTRYYTFKRKYQPERYEQGQSNRLEWVPKDYRRQSVQQQNTNKYNSNTLKIRVNFQVEGSELQSTNHTVDLHRNEEKLASSEWVKEDMKEWELGSQWPFTCYSPVQSMSCFPKFLDLSAEELRYEAYKARENNAGDLYLNCVENTLQNINDFRNHLKNPSMEVASFIEKFCTKQDVIIKGEVDGVTSKLKRSSDVDMRVDDSSC